MSSTRPGRPSAAWTDRGVCHTEDIDPELFFPTGTSGPALLQRAMAKTVCRRCPVRTDCLRWALSTRSVGIWGGTDEHDRTVLRRAGS
ncbi:WhiB family transcriptional regulator [Pseudonocardia sp. WMMC193]|uniref:WhiB family transcriptional regulator n=1 Tax=Pseudonocardia sp. WMMC193 TaxID=2911965 RepID=UPI001F2118D7|nr:WhiB family transcriptional regulator [Pseudonocardia sp. WMMC193]MCF7550232.1 WhiB family transcriptional regulator [Pseudonocardia sp. WMMC193]